MGDIVTSAADIDMNTLDERWRELMETMFHRYGTAIIDLGSADLLP